MPGYTDAHAGDILTGQVQLIEKCQNSIINAIEDMLRAETNLGGGAFFPRAYEKNHRKQKF